MVRPMAWQATLGGMVEAGVRVRQRCGPCGLWEEVDVMDLFLTWGPDHSLWDSFPPCAVCGEPTTFFTSPGPGTPFLPLVT